MAWAGLSLSLLLSVMLLSGCASNTHFNRWAEHSATVMRVQPGDTLYSIAVANDLDWRDVARWNGIRNPRNLRAGQLLRLTPPGPSAQASATTKYTPRTSAPSQVTQRQAHADKSNKARPAHKTRPASYSAADSKRPVTWKWPVKGRVISRFIDQSKQQKGLILAGSIGEPVRASAAGEVVYAGNGLPGYGNLLIIKHNSSWLSAYGYNQSLKVKEGQFVHQGQIVATMGRRDGRAKDKTGSLLFQIRHNGKPVDPMAYLPKR